MDYFFDKYKAINIYFSENSIVKEYNDFFNYLPNDWENLNSDSEYLMFMRKASAKKGCLESYKL